MAWGSLWGLFGGSGRKYGALSNVWNSIDFCWFFDGWRVSGGTWRIALGGLGCTLAAWLPAGWLDGHGGGHWDHPNPVITPRWGEKVDPGGVAGTR